MDYTLANSYVTDAGTTNRMHLQAQATPTAVADADLNGLTWEALALIKASGIVPAAFDKAVPATYTQVRDAVAIAVRNQSAAIASATGSADALVGAYTPAVPALANGLTLYLRAASANATTTPSFTPNSVLPITVKTIVKGNGLALVPGDIAGAGHWLELQYDLTLDKWVLLNPATGTATVTATNDATFANNSVRPVSTSWVRGAMAAIATAAGFAMSLSASGYIKFPSWLGSWIVQWGTLASTNVGVGFPIAFPTVVSGIFTQAQSAGNSSINVNVGLISTAGFSIYPSTGGGATTVGMYWFAFGY